MAGMINGSTVKVVEYINLIMLQCSGGGINRRSSGWKDRSGSSVSD